MTLEPDAPTRGSEVPAGWSGRRVQVLVAAAAVLLIVAVLLLRLPRTVTATGTIDQCLGGWAVVRFDGEAWKAALPDDLRAYVPGYIPVAEWPSGLSFDEAAGTLVRVNGDEVLRTGDRVRIRGSIVDVHGDPSPCYYTLGVRIEEISSS